MFRAFRKIVLAHAFLQEYNAAARRKMVSAESAEYPGEDGDAEIDDEDSPNSDYELAAETLSLHGNGGAPMQQKGGSSRPASFDDDAASATGESEVKKPPAASLPKAPFGSSSKKPRLGRSPRISIATASRSDEATRVPSSVGAKSGGRGGADSDATDDEPGDGDEDKGGTHRRSAAERTVAEANKALAKALEIYGATVHYKSSKQVKAVTKCTDNLLKWGRKTGAIDADESQALSQQIFDTVDEVSERQNLFDESRASFDQVVAMAPSRLLSSIMRGLPQDVVAKIAVQGCAKISEAALTAESAATSHHLALVAEPSPGMQPVGFGLHLLTDVGGEDYSTIAASQRTAVLAHLERILKMTDMVSMVAAIGCYVACFRNMPLAAITEALEGALGSDTAAGEYFCGRLPHIFIGLISMYVLGEVGTMMERNSAKMTKEFFHLLKMVCENSCRISARVRCYHRGGINGMSKPPAKIIWQKVEELATKLTRKRPATSRLIRCSLGSTSARPIQETLPMPRVALRSCSAARRSVLPTSRDLSDMSPVWGAIQAMQTNNSSILETNSASIFSACTTPSSALKLTTEIGASVSNC